MKKSTKIRTSIMLESDIFKAGKKNARQRDQTLSGYIASLIKSASKKSSK